MLFVLQILSADSTPMDGVLVRLERSQGTIPRSVVSDERGMFYVPWEGFVGEEPVLITADAAGPGWSTRRQIRIARPTPVIAPYITSVAPGGGHSAFAGRYLNDDIEVQIQADATRCLRTTVVVEYLNVGSAATPEPKRHEIPALWSQLDEGRFGCAAQMKWVLSTAVGEQTLRTWIKRDTTFVVPDGPEGVQQYGRPYVVRAVAHALPALLVGAALVDSTKGSSVPRIVGVDLSFPTLADLLKHNGAEGAGRFVDNVRIFAGTNFDTQIGQNVYLGIEPVVLLIGPRAADLPVAVATGRRLGRGNDEWFAAGLVNAGSFVQWVAQGLGFVAPK
jgi:hypothetical protein